MTLDEAIGRYTSNAEYERIHGSLQGCLDFRQLAEWLKELKQLREQTRWIPVSERLPLLRGSYKISDDVLITNGYENYMGYLVKRKGQIFWHYYGSDIEVGIKDEDNDATAWMPLPKPYKAERSDKE